MCPFDTYKVYKRGGNVRVDTTLVGFDNNKWQRGDRTYIFRGQGELICCSLNYVTNSCLDQNSEVGLKIVPAVYANILNLMKH